MIYRNKPVQFIGNAAWYKFISHMLLRRFRGAVRRKCPKKLGTNSLFLLHGNAPAHRSVSVKDFLVKKNMTTKKHPPNLLTCLQLIFTCYLDWTQHWRDGAFVLPMTSLRMRRQSWKCFYEMSSRNACKNFKVAGRSVLLHKGTILKEM
jgi:hypothetical protein